MICGVYVCVCLGSVRLFVLADDKGTSVFGETESKELWESVWSGFGAGIVGALKTGQLTQTHTNTNTNTLYCGFGRLLKVHAFKYTFPLSLIIICWHTRTSHTGSMQLLCVHNIIDMHMHTWAGLSLRLSYSLLANADEYDGECEMERDGEGENRLRQKGRQMKGKKWDTEAKDLGTLRRIKLSVSLFYIIPAGVCIQPKYLDIRAHFTNKPFWC